MGVRHLGYLHAADSEIRRARGNGSAGLPKLTGEKSMPRRFITAAEMQVEELPWGPHDWLCRPGLVDAEDLQLVRVLMPPGQAHRFHRHPEMEEIIYVLEGQAEQWVESERRMLGVGEIAHIPKNVVHATYNAGAVPLRFLAILSPAKIQGPALVDVSGDEPWQSLRK
jgi:quercetin dioxygenase-like cupin family protein